MLFKKINISISKQKILHITHSKGLKYVSLNSHVSTLKERKKHSVCTFCTKE